MINGIVENLKILCDNKCNSDAVVNVLNAKLAHLFSFKGISFISYNNLKTSYPLSYYGINFVPSGGVKNQLINEIDNNLLTFFREEYNRVNKKHKDNIECQYTDEMSKLSDKKDLKRKELELEKTLKELRNLKYEISNATPAALYANAEVLEVVKSGSLFLKITEFADFFDTAITNNNSTNKAVLELIFNLYDGQLDSTDTVMKSRDTIKNIPFSLMFMSDFGLILNQNKTNKAFKSLLSRGLARRSFIYINKGENYFKESPPLPSIQEKEEAIIRLEDYSKALERIYHQIPEGNKYVFSTEANEELRKWKKVSEERVGKFYENVDYLDEDYEILEKDLINSAWKITKLCVIYHLLKHPDISLIKPDAVFEAIEFYNKSYEYLENLIFKEPKNDIEKCFNFFLKNKNQWISKMQIRKGGFVDDRFFAAWFKENEDYLIESADKKGLVFVASCVGGRHPKYCLYNPAEYKFVTSKVNAGDVEKGNIFLIDTKAREVAEL